MPLRPPAGFIRPGYDPLKVPNAPTIGTATAGDAQASVSFTAPSNVGGSAITQYTAVSTPGQLFAQGSASPLTVTGLTNGTAYTFAVWALNTYGPSPYSAASGSVTPSAPTAIFFGGYSVGAPINVIQSVAISSTGNTSDFGDLAVASRSLAACGSATRSIAAGGLDNTGNRILTMSFVNPATSGNATAFGNLLAANYEFTGLSNSTRGVFGGGSPSGVQASNVLQYVTIASEGNAIDFGDLLQGFLRQASCASTTRGIFAGGLIFTDDYYSSNVIQFITIASTGNASDFGDLLTANYYQAGASSSTRGLIAGGYDPQSNVIQYVTIASAGNAIDFGDLTQPRGQLSATSSSTRAIFGGGDNINVIDYVTIASTGNAIDFGDLLQTNISLAATSNAHGGL